MKAAGEKRAHDFNAKNNLVTLRIDDKVLVKASNYSIVHKAVISKL